MRVFAYGSNLDIGQLRARTPSATRLGLGELRDHRLAFTRRSPVRCGGVADVLRAPGFVVFGAVFEIDDGELPALDRAECMWHTPPGYRRATLPIVLHGMRGPMDAEVYQVVAPAATEIAPRAQYTAQIITGLHAARATELERVGSAELIQVRRLDDYLAFVGWLCALAGDYSDDQPAPEFVRPGLLIIRANVPRGLRMRGALAQVSPRSAVAGGTAVVRANGVEALAEICVADEVPDGCLAVDQSLRAALRLPGQWELGYSAEIFSTRQSAGAPDESAAISGGA